MNQQSNRKPSQMRFELIYLLAFVFFGLGANAQNDLPIDSITKKITYTEVVQVAGATKADLYGRIKTSLKGCTAVTDDKAGAQYKGKCSFKVTYPSPMKGFPHDGTLNYIVNVGAKDGKYKYTITDIVHESNRGSGGKLENSIPECGKYTLILPGWASIKNSAKVEFPKIVTQLKSGMEGGASKSAEPAQKDDW